MLESIKKFGSNYTYQSALLAVLFFTLPFERIPSFDISIFGNEVTFRASLVAGLLFVIASLPQLFRSRKKLLLMPYLGLIGFLMAYAVSTVFSIDIWRSLWVFFYTAYVVLVAVSIALYIRSVSLQKLETILRWAAWIVIIFGLFQFIGNVMNIPASITGLRPEYSKEILGFPRIQSVGLEPLYYGNFLLFPLFILSARFIKAGSKDLVLICAIVMQIFLTVSRGALIAGVVGLVVLLVFSLRERVEYKRIGSLFLTIVFGIFFALVLSAFTRSYIQKTTNVQNTNVTVVSQATNLDSQIDRRLNREIAVRAMLTKPWFGLGPGGFNSFVRGETEIYSATPGIIIVNNEPLELLAEGGIISFLVLSIALMWIFIISARRVWIKDIAGDRWIWVVGILAFLMALLVQYQTFSTLYIMHIWVVIGALIGIVFHINLKDSN